MIIRPAKFVDIPKIVELLGTATSESKYATTAPLNREQAKRVLVECIGVQADKPGSAMCFIAERDGELIGIFLGVVRMLYECLDALMISNLVWYVTKDAGGRAALRLFDAFNEWADQAPGHKIYRYGLTDAFKEPELMAKLMARRGYRQSGVLMEKEC